jgi:hypothetical protein
MMNNPGARIVRGYRLLLAAVARTVGVVALLGVVALMISVPLWLLATQTPVLFNYLFLVVLLGGGGYLLFGTGKKKASLENIAYTSTVVVTVVLLFLGYILPAVVAAVLLSGFSAWRVSRR